MLRLTVKSQMIKKYVQKVVKSATDIIDKTDVLEKKILKIVEDKLQNQLRYYLSF